jgi:hypothetical protein
VAEKERVILVHQNKRANILIQKTAWVQAKWDAANFEERKYGLIGCGITSGIFFLLIIISSLSN